MPKTSKLELNFYRKRLAPFLLERKQTEKTVQICERLLNSLLKARSSARRKEYRERLDKIIQNLAVQSEDLVLEKEKRQILQKKYDELQARHSRMFQEQINKDS